MQRATYLCGSWYPDTAAACQATLEGHARDARPEQGSWRGIVAPHAGWRYSGAVAAHAFAWLAAAQPEPDVVVVFGSHRGPNDPDTVFRGESWDTPLGPIVVHGELADAISGELDMPDEPVQPRYPDNGIEVLLPMVRYFFPRAAGVMMGIAANLGAVQLGSSVAALCRKLRLNAVYVGSTDLTHYGPRYAFTPKGDGQEAVDWVRNTNDRAFLDILCKGDTAQSIQHARMCHSACCPGASAAAMAAVQGSGGGRTVKLIEHALSCDEHPDFEGNYVGYAGMVF